jgi:hypothetical protein
MTIYLRFINMVMSINSCLETGNADNDEVIGTVVESIATYAFAQKSGKGAVCE